MRLATSGGGRRPHGVSVGGNPQKRPPCPGGRPGNIGGRFVTDVGGLEMPKYLVEASYSPAGINGLKSEGGSARAWLPKHSSKASGEPSSVSTSPLETPTPSSSQTCRITQRSPQCRWLSTAAVQYAPAPWRRSRRAKSTKRRSGTYRFTRPENRECGAGVTYPNRATLGRSRSRPVIKAPLQKDEVLPSTELGTDLRHTCDLDKAESLVEPNRCLDSHHRRPQSSCAFPLPSRLIDECFHQLSANSRTPVVFSHVDRVLDREPATRPFDDIAEPPECRDADDLASLLGHEHESRARPAIRECCRPCGRVRAFDLSGRQRLWTPNRHASAGSPAGRSPDAF